MSPKVLFIGGTGIISSACAPLAIEQGMKLFLFNRGRSTRARPAPEGAEVVVGDISREREVEELLSRHTFDVVVNWIAYQPEDVERDIRLFRGKVGQYIFISSASAYQKPIRSLPITEATPLENPYWDYSRAKIACENRLVRAFREQGFPITIVRPSHTYDKTMLPFTGRYTVVDRMRKGKQVIIHGDGTSLWVLTHHKDFAKGFVGLLGHEQAIGEAVHITSDQLLTWNDIFATVARAAGAELKPVYIPSSVIAKSAPEWGAGLLGDKSHSVIFDNAKIKGLVLGFKAEKPYAEGCQEVIRWHDADPSRQTVDEDFSRLQDRLIAAYDK